MRTRWTPFVIAAAVAGAAAGGPLAEMKQPMLGEPAPAFRLQSLEGRGVALQDFKGKFVVLHFGTGW